MGFDPITGNYAANKALKILRGSGAVGYTEPITASFVVPASGNVTPDVELLGGSFKWFSSAMPTQEEFFAGTLTVGGEDGATHEFSMSAPSLDATVTATATGAYCVRLHDMFFIVSTVLENEIGTLPKTGMYYSTHSLNGVFHWEDGALITFDFGETIHPIDQKYLPGVYMPVVESGLTLELNTEYALPDALTAALDAAAESKTPIVFGFVYKEFEFLVPMCYVRTEESRGWQGQALCDAVIAALIECRDARWMCTAMALMAL